MSSAQWFVLQVMPRHEKAVGALLTHKGYLHFVPTSRVARKWSDRTKVLEQPLFPGYIFFKTQRPAMDLVRDSLGVIRIVSFGGKPSPVADEEIEALQRVVQSTREVTAVSYVAIGQKVQIVTGPLSGITGFIAQVKNRDRLIVSVAPIMRSISVEIDRSEIALVH